MCEAARNHEKLLRTRAMDYGPGIAGIAVGFAVPAPLYIKALRTRMFLKQEMERLSKSFDVLAAPTTTTLAPRIDQPATSSKTAFGSALNLLGLPALSVPCGFSMGLPIGMQIIGGKPFDEPLILRVGHRYQMKTNWHLQHPSI